jgi:hypothetical protein
MGIEKERLKSKSKFSSNLQIAIWEALCLLFVHLYVERAKKVSFKIPNMNQTMPWMEQEEKKKSHDPERER